jgi:hypothetical protein
LEIIFRKLPILGASQLRLKQFAAENAALKARISELERRLGLNSSNARFGPLAKIYMTLMRIFRRTAVISFGCAVAIGAAAEAQPLSTDRDMFRRVVVPDRLGLAWDRTAAEPGGSSARAQ